MLKSPGQICIKVKVIFQKLNQRLKCHYIVIRCLAHGVRGTVFHQFIFFVVGVVNNFGLLKMSKINWNVVLIWHEIPVSKYLFENFPHLCFLVDDDVHVHSVLPGVVNTNIYRHLPFRKSAFVSLSFAPFLWFLMKSDEDGAQTLLYALLSESAGKTTGKIYK